jgi:hypothetical protein
LKAQVLEHSPLWSEPSTNYLSGRTAAFFCYGDDGANDGATVFLLEINSLAIAMCSTCARNFIVIFVDER